MSEPDLPEAQQEVVLVTRPVTPPVPGRVDLFLRAVSASVGLAAYTATTMVSLVEQTVTSAVDRSVNGALDRLVPAIADAIIERLDLTDIVLSRVDLERIVNSALDSLDLTKLVIDRVDIDEVVAQADLDVIIDRIPVIPLANFVIEEIDLPQIIRESTGGVATDAVNAIRVQGVGADQLVSRLADRVLLRRRQRRVDTTSEPESLIDRMKDDLDSSERESTFTSGDVPPAGTGEKKR